MALSWFPSVDCSGSGHPAAAEEIVAVAFAESIHDAEGFEIPASAKG
jgi:hypothetical protein